MKSTLCLCLIGLIASISSESIAIASERSTDDAPTNASENSKVTGTMKKKADDTEKQSDDIISQSATEGDIPSEMGTRGLFSDYSSKSLFGNPFSRSPRFSRRYDMFPPSPFSDQFDSFYGNSRYGDEDVYHKRYPTMGYDKQYPGAYGGYGMMGQYDESFYPGMSQGRYPTYNQQLPPSSYYYSDRPNTRPQEYYRGQPAGSQQFSTQGTPNEESNIQLQRPHDSNQLSTSYYQDQRKEPQQFDTISLPYNPDQRRRPSTNLPAQDNRDQRTNSNVARPDASSANGSWREPQSTDAVFVPQRRESNSQPLASLAPARDQRMETSSTKFYTPPNDRNRVNSNIQLPRPHDRNQPSTSYTQDQRREPQQFDTISLPYNPAQRGRPSTNLPAQGNRDQHMNSNVARPDASSANGNWREPQSTDAVLVPQQTESNSQPLALLVPARDQRMETSSTTSVSGSSDNHTQHNESDLRP